jgi:hypothetical protein
MNDRLNRPARVREACAVIGGFVALTLAMTYPMVAHMRTALPNDLGDPLLNAWILAWDSDRMLHGLRGLWQAPVFYPYADTLAYSEHLLGIAVIFAPVQWLFGNLLLTYNVAFLFAYVLAGCGTYLLVKSLTGNRWAAWIAGIAFAFCPYRAAQIPHLQMLTSGWMPLGLWALHRYFAQGRRRALLGFSAAFLLQALSNGYSLYFFAVPVAVIVIDGLVRARARGRMAMELAAAFLVMAAVFMPVALAYNNVRQQVNLVRMPAEIQTFSADLNAYLRTTPMVLFWGDRLPRPRPEGELFAGATLMTLAVVALAIGWRRSDDTRSPATRRVVLLYAASGTLALILSLGSHPRVWGVPILSSGPYQWLLAVVPGLDGLRVPSRFAMVVFLALSVLAGIAVARVLPKCSRVVGSIVGVLLAGAILAEGYTGPIPYEPLAPRLNAADTDVYAWLAERPPGGVLELPVQGDEPTHSLLFMYRTLAHRHPIVNGFSGFTSPLFDFLKDPGVTDLTQMSDVVRGLRSIGVRYIVVHEALYRNRNDGRVTAAKLRGLSEQTQDVHAAGLTTAIQLQPASPLRWNSKFLREIPPTAFVATASDQQERLPLAFDGNVNTRWFNGERQSGDEWLAFRFDRPLTVARLTFEISPRSMADYARGLRVESSTDGTNFDTVLFEDVTLPALLSGIARRVNPVPLEIDLIPNVSRALRVRQTGQTGTLYWSVDELKLWTPDAR